MTTPPPDPPEAFFAGILAWLSRSVAGRGLQGLLPQALVGLIIDRLRGINQRVARVAARIRAGRYRPRVIATPRRQPSTPPRAPDPLPRTAGWLLTLVPDSVHARGQLEVLFRDPAMAELLAAAPAGFARPLRALCRMLGVEPPAVLALPRRPRPSRPPRPRTPKPSRPTPARPSPPPPQDQPAWMRLGTPRRSWSLVRKDGSPRRG